MIDYTIFYKSELSVKDKWSANESWDVFISAYNSTERVAHVFDKAKAKQKFRLIFPEYSYRAGEYPENDSFSCIANNEAEYIRKFFESAKIDPSSKICIDLTGFIRPYQMFLTTFLWMKGSKRFDALYSEPNVYREREKTSFSSGVGGQVRQVMGLEGSHSANTSNDLLIIGSGYDDELISRVGHYKDSAKKVQILGLPSLRPDMYQENELRALKAEEDLGESVNYFAPANDPFVTASVLSEIAERFDRKNKITNLYLSPLASKAQVLGFSLFYKIEGGERSTSIIYPFRPAYSRETTKGISRIWKYVVEI